jgi:anti-anti-sigma factor
MSTNQGGLQVVASLIGSSFDRFTLQAPRITSEGDTTVIWLTGEQDVAVVEALRAAMRIERGRPAFVVVDLRGVTFIDISTIRALTDAVLESRTTEWALTLRAPSPCVRRMLELCGRSELLDVA